MKQTFYSLLADNQFVYFANGEYRLDNYPRASGCVDNIEDVPKLKKKLQKAFQREIDLEKSKLENTSWISQDSQDFLQTYIQSVEDEIAALEKYRDSFKTKVVKITVETI